MSHTNSTTNYALPQFITTDKPAWLTDVNNAYLAIDTGMHNAQDKADSAQNDATQALSDASAAATAAATADAKGAGAIASIADTFDPSTIYAVDSIVMYNNLLYICTVAIITPGPWTGSANWARINIEDLIIAVKTALDSATSFAVNDTIALRYKILPGIVTAGNTTIQFFVPTNKIIDTGVITNASLSGSTFRVYDSESSEQVAITDGTWSFNLRTDGILCTCVLDNPISAKAAVNIYFASTTTLTLIA